MMYEFSGVKISKESSLPAKRLVKHKIVETFKPGVEVSGYMGPETGNNPLKKHRQSTEKDKRIMTTTIHF